MQMIIQVAGILTLTIVTNEYKQSLANKLYNFTVPDTKESYKRSKDTRKVTSTDFSDRKITVPLKIKKPFNKIRVGFMDNIKYMVDFKRKNSKMLLLNNAFDSINSKLDILFIVKKLSELEKIKMLLFDEDQLCMFNHLPKPIFSVSSEKNKDFPVRAEKSGFISRWESLFDCNSVVVKRSKKQILKNSYENMMNKTNQSDVDKKILEVFQSKKPFNISSEIEFQKTKKDDSISYEDI